MCGWSFAFPSGLQFKYEKNFQFLFSKNTVTRIGFSHREQLDFYTEQVLPGDSIRFENVNISPSEPIRIDVHTTGINGNALPHYMVGIDRFEVKKWLINRSRE